MATIVGVRPRAAGGEGFWLVSAALMAAVLVAGFSVQLAMGRSSFAAPPHVHLHALLFFGWTVLYLVQSALSGRAVRLHKRLGWLAVGWVPAMLVVGTLTTVIVVRRGAVPFFFPPLYFLVMNPLSLLAFAGLASAAIVLRRQTHWHRRLMLCAMAVLTGPGWGRLLPVPLFIPWVGWSVFAAVMLFPLAGVIRDARRNGQVHPAWGWGIGAILCTQVTMDLVTNSPAGSALYAAVTHGSPGAAIGPRAYPPFPGP